jgi:hypothetical protein
LLEVFASRYGQIYMIISSATPTKGYMSL